MFSEIQNLDMLVHECLGELFYIKYRKLNICCYINIYINK